MGDFEQYRDFEAIHVRLQEIVEAVGDDGLPLDDALDLYEEAVALGLRVSDLLEEGIELSDAADEAGESGAVENAVAESATTTPEPQVEAVAYAE
uniref:Exonuclease VII small subunit n=1 Tax=uncultured bacterium Contigcl_1769 TaxID=1393659 RepID=W0FMB8_9BACT|nr:exonuclease VII small subunit [uncultured bacterium Contigcl_1769]